MPSSALLSVLAVCLSAQVLTNRKVDVIAVKKDFFVMCIDYYMLLDKITHLSILALVAIQLEPVAIIYNIVQL